MFRCGELVQRRRRRQNSRVHVVLRGMDRPVDDSNGPIVPKNVDFVHPVRQRVQKRLLKFHLHGFAHVRCKPAGGGLPKLICKLFLL